MKGPAWDAAFEQRLFIEALLDTFQGDRASRLLKAEELEAAAPTLRRSARAKTHQPAPSGTGRDGTGVRAHNRDDDARELSGGRGLAAPPPLGDALRGAIVALETGTCGVRAGCWRGAAWPAESAFHVYHQELPRLAPFPEAAGAGVRW